MLEVFLEEPSAEAALGILIPRIVPGLAPDADFAMRVFNGKSDLLRKLPQRLRGFASYAQAADLRLLLLLDRDDEDCTRLKDRITGMARQAGVPLLGTDTGSPAGAMKVRIACEELEAWFLGDPGAMRAAYPRLKDFEKRSGFRDPDAVPGGTWESLERLLQKAGYFPGGIRKIELARTVSAHMTPEHNSSVSFQQFCRAVRDLTE